MENKVITLRTVFKTKEYHFQPTKQPNGLNWPFVKPVRVDHDGVSYMNLSEAERNDPNSKYFIPEDLDIVVTEGTTFDLSDPLQYNKWMAIKDNDLIVPTRNAKDPEGNFLIDGDKKRYGIAEIYVDVAGEASERSINRRKQIHEAQQYIFNDSPNGILTKCRLMGRNMKNAPLTDAQDYLLQLADKTPARIIDLYTGQDTGLQLMILDGKDKGILKKVNGWYMYGETNLGANDEAVVAFLKTPMNKPIFDALRKHIYPEFAIQMTQPTASTTVSEEAEAVEDAPKPSAPARKTTKKS